MTGLQELQNEGNGLGLANTTAPRKLYGDRGDVSVSSVQDDRFVVSIQVPRTGASFLVSRGGQPMNIRVLVVDDEPLARVGITTRLSSTIIARMSLGHGRSSVTH